MASEYRRKYNINPLHLKEKRLSLTNGKRSFEDIEDHDNEKPFQLFLRNNQDWTILKLWIYGVTLNFVWV